MAFAAKKLLLPLGLMCLGVVCAITLLEMILRPMVPPVWESEQGGIQFWSTQYDLPFVDLSPGVSGQLYGAKTSINSLGVRGAELPLQSPDGTFRIAIMGDSLVFGYGVSDQETFPVQFESLLEKKYPQANIEVVNFGVWGHGLWEHYHMLRSKVLKFQPDLILLTLYLNDFTTYRPFFEKGSKGNSERKAASPAKNSGRPTAGEPRESSNLTSVLQYLRLKYILIRKQLLVLQLVDPVIKSFFFQLLSELGLRKGVMIGGDQQAVENISLAGKEWQKFTDQIKAIYALSRKSNVDMVAVLFPLIANEDGTVARLFQGRLSTFLDESDIPYIDLQQFFIGQNLLQYRINILDAHPRAEFYSQIARYLEHEVRPYLPDIKGSAASLVEPEA